MSIGTGVASPGFDRPHKLKGACDMMTIRTIANYLAAEPFRPFRIKMASGQAYEIRHPEMLMAGRSSVRVYTADSSDPDGPEKWHDISMMLMECLEPLDQKNSTLTN